ncbi:uncharacterized protein LOC116791767 [Chiroxiphia lanceolata]|uniref:Uncharacterized protein LOC113989908 n=1 Tax=Pipra filicauda TaxID=649802 RepID=A0A6J2GYZ6_9PASS|nr:uncharacterized protein LOC113950647 [Corapipo altera]XP_027580679.1 uncharacterized protein LOC113989908 [Pipra filicauda]XP_032553972.1 uncharacterized protein LOC116791767 [Chiroxiphia lanceolata]
MESLDTEVRARKTLGTVEYVESSGFAQGVLPTRKDVVQNMLYLLQPKRAGQAQRSKEDAAQLLAEHLQEHWLVCNLHTIATQNIKKLILKMYEEFTRLYQTRKQRQNQKFSDRADKFNESSEKLFDVFCTDTQMRDKLEEYSGIKMTSIEWKFLEDQRSERKMYYEDFTEKQELKMMERRQKIQCLEHFRKLAREEKEGRKAKARDRGEEQSDEGTSVDESYPAEEENGGAPAFSLRGRRKRRCTASTTAPLEGEHIRMSIRRVRPGFYETVEKVKNC